VKKSMLMAFILFFLMLTGAQLSAAELDERVYFVPALSFIFADKDRNADDNFGAYLGIGKQISESLNFEAALIYDELDFDQGSGEFDQRGLLIDYLYMFDRDPGFSPYALLGAGALRTKTPNERSVNPMANIGLGFMRQLSDNGLQFRTDVRYRMDFDGKSLPEEDRFGDWVINVGLAIPFGKKPEPKPIDADGDGVVDDADICPGTPMGIRVNVRGCEIDSDGDGIADSEDRCASTPRGATVDSRGCELDSDGDGIVDSQDQCATSTQGARVDVRGCEIDSDGDGVADSLDQCSGTLPGVSVNAQGCEGDSDGDGILDSQDQCANTSAGMSVDEKGCEADSDGDGIADSQDQCSNTNAGAQVDVRGCELDSDNDGIVDSIDNCAETLPGTNVDIKGCKIPEVVVLEGVTFESGSVTLTQASLIVLNDVAATLLRNPEIKAEIAGYTDNRGSVALNKRLSEKRAIAVLDYLISQGVASANLAAKGYGPVNPIADNNTADGRALNRRVEMHIIK